MTVRLVWNAAVLAAVLAAAGCASVRTEPSAEPAAPPAPARVEGSAARAEGVVAKSDRFVIYRAGRDDTLRSLAARFLGDEARYWQIADHNEVRRVEPGSLVVIPLQPFDVTGVYEDRYQTVPVLCYHRFGSKPGKMVVTPEAFAAQLQYLADNDYRVIRLSELKAFLDAKRPLPKRAVVLTIDDGYASTYQYALPLLKQHGFPATVFVYPDFIGARDALRWTQMKEMVDGGLIEIESHSKSHANLTEVLPGESDQQYGRRVDAELRASRELLQKKLGIGVTSLAYPYGDANAAVAQRTAKAGYDMALTVNPGGNPFFAYPYMLQRTMIFGEHDLDAFKARLQTSKEIPAK